MIIRIYLLLIMMCIMSCQTPAKEEDEKSVVRVEHERKKLILHLEELKVGIDTRMDSINEKMSASSDKWVNRLEEVNLELVNEREKVQALLEDVRNARGDEWDEVKDGANYVAIEVKNTMKKIDKEKLIPEG